MITCESSPLRENPLPYICHARKDLFSLFFLLSCLSFISFSISAHFGSFCCLSPTSPCSASFTRASSGLTPSPGSSRCLSFFASFLWLFCLVSRPFLLLSCFHLGHLRTTASSCRSERGEKSAGTGSLWLFWRSFPLFAFPLFLEC